MFSFDLSACCCDVVMIFLNIANVVNLRPSRSGLSKTISSCMLLGVVSSRFCRVQSLQVEFIVTSGESALDLWDDAWLEVCVRHSKILCANAF